MAGLGGGAASTITVVIVSDIFSIRNRGLIQGVGNVIHGLGGGLGGVFGGWISERWGWRWAFAVQVPVIVISTVAIAMALDLPAPAQAPSGAGGNQTRENSSTAETETEQETEIERQQKSISKLSRVDFSGSVTLVTALILLLTALNSGGNLVPWTHPLIITSLLLVGLFLAAFVHIETYVAKEPIIPLHLLAGPSVLAACLANWFRVMAGYTMVRIEEYFFSFISLPTHPHPQKYTLVTLKNPDSITKYKVKIP